MRTDLSLVLLAGMLLQLPGCGLKGDLYIPEKAPAAAPAPAAPEAAGTPGTVDAEADKEETGD